MFPRQLIVLVLTSVLLIPLAYSTTEPNDLCVTAMDIEYDYNGVTTGRPSRSFFKEEAVQWLVSLQLADIASQAHFCSGTIVGERFILTTAFCVKGYQPEDIQVLAGGGSTIQEDIFQQMRRVSKIILHPQYNEFTGLDDIALLYLRTELKFDSHVAAVSPELSGHPNGCVLKSWSLEEGVVNVRALKEIKFNLVPKSICEQDYPHVLEGMFCASASSDEYSLCEGNWGAPLICGNEFGGLLSWRNGCTQNNLRLPYVFTTFEYHRQWILHTMIQVFDAY